MVSVQQWIPKPEPKRAAGIQDFTFHMRIIDWNHGLNYTHISNPLTHTHTPHIPFVSIKYFVSFFRRGILVVGFVSHQQQRPFEALLNASARLGRKNLCQMPKSAGEELMHGTLFPQFGILQSKSVSSRAHRIWHPNELIPGDKRKK